ncbi:sensor histidine kinase [bacterium]|nr:sensor histidine kinase [bacterium]
MNFPTGEQNNMTRKSFGVFTIAFIFLSSFLCSANSYASDSLNVSEIESEIGLVGHNIIFDGGPAESLSFEDIQKENNATFIPYKPEVVRVNSWFKIEVLNDTESKISQSVYLVENSFHKVTFYKNIFDADNLVSSATGLGGASVPVFDREYPTSIPISTYELEPGQRLEMYIRTDIRKNGVFNIFVGDTSLALERAFNEVILVYTYLGLVTSLILYQLFLYLSFKDNAHIVYFCFGLSMVGVIYVGGGQIGIHMDGIPNLDVVFNIVRTLTGIFVIALPMSIFDSKKHFPKFDYIGRIFVWLISTLTVTNLIFDFVPFKVLSDVGHVLSIPFCLSLAVNAVIKKMSGAKIFLFAWTLFLSGVTIWILKNNGAFQINYFTRHCATFASGIEIILVGYAVAIKVKHNEEKRIVAEQKMKESEELRRLLRVVCHDISNPLTMVQVAVEKKRLTDNETAWSWVERSLHMVVDIINHVRKLEAIKSGKMNLDLEKVNIKELIEEVVFVFQTKLEDKNIALVTSEIDDELCVLSDKTTLLNDVICNFISNSIKFSNPGEKITLNVEEDINKGSINIKIRDFGIGIPTKILDKMFDASHSTTRKGTSNEKGTGFGMPLAKSFMDKYGGTIHISSIENSVDPDNCGTQTILTLKKAR